MDFARKQLEKYGWTDGKGLGKHENGISEALKPKLKRSVTGIGHDAAAEFTEHWWTKLYNTAASNVEVKEKNGKTKKIKTKDDEFEITNSSWSYKKKNKNKSKEEYTNFFVKTSILSNGGANTEDLNENKIEENAHEVKLTDEQLFAACEGRTAHKGARHGLKALGKLARIEMQEEALLQQARYKGYSHAKNKAITDHNLSSNKEKKVKEQCPFNESDIPLANDLFLGNEPVKKVKRKIKETYDDTSNDNGDSKINKLNNQDVDKNLHQEINKDEESVATQTKKKKKRKKTTDLVEEEEKQIEEVEAEVSAKRKKGKINEF